MNTVETKSSIKEKNNQSFEEIQDFLYNINSIKNVSPMAALTWIGCDFCVSKEFQFADSDANNNYTDFSLMNVF